MLDYCAQIIFIINLLDKSRIVLEHFYVLVDVYENFASSLDQIIARCIVSLIA